MLGEVRNTTGQPNVAPGIAPLPPGVPIIRTPLVNFNQANPSQLGGNPGAAQQRFQYPAAPRYDRGRQRVYGRQRVGGYRGRKNNRSSFSNGPRGGGNTNFRAQGVATNSQFRGNGRTDQGNYGYGSGFSWVYCWSCNTANPNQNQVCSNCYNRLF